MARFLRLRVRGFKSFPERSDLVFARGLTGVIGPNGVGKSNMVEALRWLIGEQSAPRLRGQALDDVIFAGSPERPAYDLAEVSLALECDPLALIDGQDRAREGSEKGLEVIEITRRVVRGQGSEFEIAGRSARARDVQRLFADMGWSPQTPFIVNQGQVSDLIRASAIERRRILDDVSGISGLHLRRHEAELKLAATANHLEQADRHIAESRARIAVLEKQARQARSFRRLGERLRTKQAQILALSFSEGQAQKTATVEHSEKVRQVASAAVTALADSEAQCSTLLAALPGLQDAVHKHERRLQAFGLQHDRLEQEEQRRAQEEAGLEKRAQECAHDHERAQAQHQDAEKNLERCQQERSHCEEECQQESQKLQTSVAEQARIVKSNAGVTQALQAATEQWIAHKADTQAAQSRYQDICQRLARSESEIASCAQDVMAAEAGLKDLDISAITRQAQSAQQQAQAASKARTQAEQENEGREAATAQAQAALHLVLEQAQVLDSEKEGLERVIADKAVGVSLLANLEIPPGLEAALGAALEDELGSSLEPAAARGFCVLPPVACSFPAGVVPLSQLVEAPAALARRLSFCGLLEQESAGARLHVHLSPGQRLVDRHGALWAWDGLRAASHTTAAATQRVAVLQRARTASRDRAALDAPIAQARQELKIAQEQHRLGREELQRCRQTERERAHNADRLGQQLRAQEKRQAALQEKITARHSTLASKQQQKDELTQARRAHEQAQADQDQKDHHQEVAQWQAQAEELNRQLAHLNSAIAHSRSRLEHKRALHTELAQQITQWQQRKTAAQKFQQDVVARRAAYALEHKERRRPEDFAEQRAALAQTAAAVEKERRIAAEQRADHDQKLRQAQEQRRRQDQRTQEIRSQALRAEMTAEQATKALAQLEQETQSHFGCSGAEFLAAHKPELGETPGDLSAVRERLQSEVERLRHRQEQVGAVNLLAEKEQTQAQEQLASFCQEREDLAAALARLRRAIGQLNREASERLLASLEEVNTIFGQLFAHVFGAGSAQLKLVAEEPEQPLSAGLEITAQLPGKRVQPLRALSGGEQALLALILLLATMWCRPPPLIVLDEVDAALDDHNLQSFCRLLKDCAAHTPFLIITHNKLTMRGMDHLYGVAMSTPGVSHLYDIELAQTLGQEAARAPPQEQERLFS